MRRFSALLILISICLFPCSSVFAADSSPVKMKAILILASNNAGPIDRKIAAYEAKLKSLFKFKHYRQISADNVNIALPGKSSIRLNDYLLKVDLVGVERGKIRTQFKWLKGKKTLINTTLMMSKGSPMVLGGPSQRDGHLIMILVAQ